MIFENWKLEIKENYNSYTRSGPGAIPGQARKISQGKNKCSEADAPQGVAAEACMSGQAEGSRGLRAEANGRAAANSAKRIRAHDGCLGIRRR